VRRDPAIAIVERYFARLQARGEHARALRLAVRWYCG
jgi:hypothetical protein